MKRTTSLLFCILTLTATAVIAIANDDNDPVTIQKIRHGMAAPINVTARPTSIIADAHRMARMKKAAENGLTADFSIRGGEVQDTVWAENFDNGSDGWTLQNGPEGYVAWKLAGMTTPPYEGDVQSLTLDAPYQTWKREKAHATSQAVAVPANATLHALIYGGKVYNDYATLTISISTDDFATETELWKSTAITENGSKWHAVDLDLAAFAGKTAKIRFAYGAGTKDDMDVGGYMYEYGIDGIALTGVAGIAHIDVQTGEEIHFTDMSTGNPTSWEWTFPGGVPETSTEQNPVVYYTKGGQYDVTLKVADAEGEDVKTIEGFVRVTGKKPVPSFRCPASFRDAVSHLKMVAPLVPVQYHDTSTGFPTSWTWLLTNGPTSDTDEYKHEQDPWIAYNFLGKQYAILVADNDEPDDEDEPSDLMSKAATDSVLPKYDGLICNLLDTDSPTNYDMAGDGKFPGACKMAGSNLQGFAEKFSKPSRPILVYGAYVYATEAAAEETYDQVMPVKFSLTRSDNGVPGEVIDFDSWTIPEIGYAIRNNNGMITVEFSKPHIIDEEFFITVTDLPEKSETLQLTFAMAPMRDKDNTALMLKDGEWRPMTGYFEEAPGGQTSFYAFPSIAHSVITPLPVGKDTVEVTREGGTTRQELFSYLGYKFEGSDAGWCSVTNMPNGLTLDTLDIRCDPLPEGMEKREATLTFTDSVTTIPLVVVQRADNVSAVTKPETAPVVVSRRYYTTDGREMGNGRPAHGVNIVREVLSDGKERTTKVIKDK